MKKTVQKAASLLLSLLFLLALVPMASAVTIDCQHDWKLVEDTTVSVGDARTCKAHHHIYQRCWHCGMENYENERTYYTYPSHTQHTTSANCDGRTQTLSWYCSRCSYHGQTVQRCPNAPHTRECTALPLSVGPEVTIK